MLHGKKGFERIVWAFKNVLNHSVTWLFHDFTPNTEHGKATTIRTLLNNKVTDCGDVAKEPPITKYHPVTKECLPQQRIFEKVRVPDFSNSRSSYSDEAFEDWALEIYEWLGLVAIGSPRVCSEDAIDPFLSRYQVPDCGSGKFSSLVTLTWTGLIPNYWVRNFFICLLR